MYVRSEFVSIFTRDVGLSWVGLGGSGKQASCMCSVGLLGWLGGITEDRPISMSGYNTRLDRCYFLVVVQVVVGCIGKLTTVLELCSLLHATVFI